MKMADPEYSLSWDTFKTNICDGFTNLQQQGEFVDMTLAADGHYVKVHRSLIALASPYLKEIITSIPCQHPVVFLNNINYDELCYTLEYIYTGEVQIPTQKIGKFLKIAKSLHIKGIQDSQNNEVETSGHTTQHASLTVEETNSQNKLPRLVMKRLPSQKETSMSLPLQEKTPRQQITHRGRGRPLKVSRADRFKMKRAIGAVNGLSSDNTETNVEPQPIESVSTSPGVREFLTINKAQSEANQKDDTVSLSDFFLTDDKEREPVQENNVQSFLTDTFPITMDAQDVNSNVDTERARPMSLDILSNDLFLKGTNTEPNLPNQSNGGLFPGKIIDFGTGTGENVFKIKVLSQEDVSRTKADIFNDHINSENYGENEFEMQEGTCNENIQPCSTLHNFENIIDQHTNTRTSQPAAQFSITLTDGQNVSIQSVNTEKPPEMSTAMDCSSSQNSNSYQDPSTNLNDNDIKDSCCPLYTVSNQGSLQLILNRYIYACHHKSRKDQLLRRWRCVSYRPTGCKAVIDTDGELILRRLGIHNHLYHDNKILEKTRQGKVFSTIAASNVEAEKIRNDSAVAVNINF